MVRKTIGTGWDRDNRNAINDNFKKLFDEYTKSGLDASEAKDKAIQAVADSLLAKDIAETTRQEMINIIREQTAGGDIVPEVVQARGSHSTVGDRLNSINQDFAQREQDSSDRGINLMFPPAPLVGAKGDGTTDDTVVIQNIINHANDNGGRKVFVPKAGFLISAPILLNGCTLEGVTGNIYSDLSKGSHFIAKTKDFIAIKQGSIATKDIQFGISDILVQDALIGFELNYVINSKFDRLYAKNCDIGFKLGDSTSVGSMFCEFNQLYTSGCRIGVESKSKDFFNNNVFNNGFIQGTEKAFYLEVLGGYGAVNNVFNNVEFRSPLGRGVELKNVINATFNNPYFEVGGNSIRTLNFCTFTLNDPIFGLFKAANTNLDASFIYAVGGIRYKVNGGTIFLTSENDNTYFYDAADLSTHSNIFVQNNIRTVGIANNFNRFRQSVNEVAYQKEEQVKVSPVTNVPASSYADIDVTFDRPFSKTPEVCIGNPIGNNFDGNTISWIRFAKNSTSCSFRIYNSSSSTARNVQFEVYAKVL